MSADDTKSRNLMDAHDAMAAVLDAKWPNLLEWKAFRAIERELLASLTKPTPARAPTSQARPQGGGIARIIPYMTLAERAMDETGKPITTTALMDYISARRPIGDDPKKAKIVVQSSLSKDERFRSIPWEGGRAWWYADKPVPKKEAAG
jgi:hypothetical protein